MESKSLTSRKKKKFGDGLREWAEGIRTSANEALQPAKDQMNTYRRTIEPGFSFTKLKRERAEQEAAKAASLASPEPRELVSAEQAISEIHADEKARGVKPLPSGEGGISTARSAQGPLPQVEDEPVRTALTASKNIKNAEKQFGFPVGIASLGNTEPAENPLGTASPTETLESPVVPNDEPQESNLSASELMTKRAREDLESKGIDVSALETSVAQEQESLTTRKKDLSAAVRQVRNLRKSGNTEEADALANEIRLARQELESDFKQNVANKRLLQGDQSFLTDDEKAAEFETRRQSRIDLLDRNLPLQRDSAQNELTTARAADQSNLDRYGLDEGSSPEEIQRATKGVGLPASGEESAIARLDRLNSFDIEGFVNKPITSRSRSGREDAISRALGVQPESSYSQSNTPGEVSVGDFNRLQQDGTVSTGDETADSVIEDTKNGAYVNAIAEAVKSNDIETARATFTSMIKAMNAIPTEEGRIAYARMVRGKFKDAGLSPGSPVSSLSGDDGLYGSFGDRLKQVPKLFLYPTIQSKSFDKKAESLDTKFNQVDAIGKDFFDQINAVDPIGANDQKTAHNDKSTAMFIRRGEISIDDLTPEDRERLLKKYPDLGTA